MIGLRKIGTVNVNGMPPLFLHAQTPGENFEWLRNSASKVGQALGEYLGEPLRSTKFPLAIAKGNVPRE